MWKARVEFQRSPEPLSSHGSHIRSMRRAGHIEFPLRIPSLSIEFVYLHPTSKVFLVRGLQLFQLLSGALDLLFCDHERLCPRSPSADELGTEVA